MVVRWLFLTALLLAAPLQAQDDPDWNTPRALELIERARELRQQNTVDSAFQSYHTTGRGFLYFYFDRNDTDELTLVKTDQIALELWWQAPDETRQRIVGLRDAKTLPTNIRYHLDHLTVVQDEFADVIRIGDGDEVSAVVHPVAPGSEQTYDFRLVDSVTIEFPDPGAAPVRVYQLDVRPRNVRAPGFVGQLYLDRASGAIVRMQFTFTAASYVDPSLDRITISLDNSLWEGKYWLPYRQEAEVRRELPILDLVGGSVIRGRFEIGPYDLNVPVGRSTLNLPRVSAAPEAERLAFPFEVPIYSQLEVEGLTTPPSFEEIEARARQMIQDRYLSGISKLRVYLPSTSDAVRYNRAEGLFGGGGVSLRWIPGAATRLQFGYAGAAGHLSGSVSVSGLGVGEDVPTLGVFANQLRDMGPLPGSTMALNSLSSLMSHADYLDPYFASGARASFPFRTGSFAIALSLSIERHHSASLEVDNEHGEFRPVRPIDDGDLAAADLGVRYEPAGAGWSLGLSGRLGRFRRSDSFVVDEAAGTSQRLSWNPDVYGALGLQAEWAKEVAWRALHVSLDANAGIVSDGAPLQELFLLGGRSTLLGHPYRAFVGDRFWLARGEASRALRAPWITARVFASAGWAERDGHVVPWSASNGRAGLKASVGGGLGLLWDVVNFDVGRGLGPGGKWSVAFSAGRKFRKWM